MKTIKDKIAVDGAAGWGYSLKINGLTYDELKEIMMRLDSSLEEKDIEEHMFKVSDTKMKEMLELIVDELRTNHKLQALKLMKEATGESLEVAKGALDAMVVTMKANQHTTWEPIVLASLSGCQDCIKRKVLLGFSPFVLHKYRAAWDCSAYGL